ncbi:MAG: arylsulfatase [Phycisphaeraceae bacterium]
MTLSYRLLAVAILASLFAAPPFAQAAPRKPNIVLIYCDDLGYGDVSCYGATRVQTPHIDKLAAGGLRFTDGHCPAATCTPSRYAMLTGEYAFRLKGTGIARGDAPAIIKPGRVTLASTLKDAGYTTGVVGKWHLGLGDPGMDFNGDIKPGPLEIGFDYCFLMPATGDRVPCVYVEDYRVVGLDPKDPIEVSFNKKVGNEPTGKENPELLTVMKPSHGHNSTIINGISRIGWMSGGKSARWKDEDIADDFTKKAVAFIEKSAGGPTAGGGAEKPPFFLFFSLHDVHVPRVPHPRFVGKTPMGPRGDVIVETDWCVGQIMSTLEKHGLIKDTLVIFTSDNGPVIDDGYQDDSVKLLGDHQAAGPFRGGKYSHYEGGTRVPFIVSWPGVVKPGESSALVCQVDFISSFAAMTGTKVASDAAPDSFDVMPALLGESKVGRETLVEQAGRLALRKGAWKYAPGGGGAKKKQGDGELYNLAEDIGETKNVAEKHPKIAAEMEAMLEKIRMEGRSRP